MSLAQFVKQHTAIPNEFVDSFLAMYDPETSQTDMTIDMDVVSRWLNSTKSVLLRTLRASYKQGIDYQEVKSVKRVGKYGGNNYKKVMISPDCFKRLCMRSATKRSEEVRSYFIALESLIVRYKTHMLDGMQREINKMEKELKPKDIYDSAGYIYVIKASKDYDSIYKIGRTKDLNKRLSTYKTGNFDNIDVVYKFRTENLNAVEKCIKGFLKEFQLRKYKELYQANLTIVKNIIEGCGNVGLAGNRLKKHYEQRSTSKLTGGYYVYVGKE